MLRFVLILALSLLAGPMLPAAEVAKTPNILVILADDLGYGDVRCLNPQGKIPTPHLDRFASEGMIFTDAHTTSSVCSPTRYGLLTGRYNWRSKLQNGVLGGLSPRLIEPGRETVASVLKAKGYHTACVGKWHLGMDWVLKPGKRVSELNIEPRDQVFNVEYDQPIRNGPNAVGFDYYFGISASLDMVPYTYIENDHVTKSPTEDRDFPLMLGRAMGRCRKGPAAPGFEAENVLPDLTAKCVEYIGSRANAVKSGTPFFLYVPLASPHTPILPTKEWQGKTGLNYYGDFTAQTDDAMGKMLAALDKHGMRENTLVIITSDNGCSPQADFPALLAKGHNPSGPFRGHKADIYEGGHRVPFLARWPAQVKAGTTTANLTSTVDILATCAEIVGAKVPANAGEDSISFLPTLLGKAAPRTLLVHHSINGSFAIREGKWKLCLCPGSGGWSAPRPGQSDTSALPLVQLFDLEADIAETKNVQDHHADTVAKLTKSLQELVAKGRSTPGEPQANAVNVDIWKAGKAAHQPPKKKP